MYNKTSTFSNTEYCVMMTTDDLGTGYLAQPSQFLAEAQREGWELVKDGMSYGEACRLRNELRNGTVQLHEVA